jgi:hypothetical protein
MSRPREERDGASEWLKDFLSCGPQPATEVEAQCEAAGFRYRTLQRCKEGMGVRSFRRMISGIGSSSKLSR